MTVITSLEFHITAVKDFQASAEEFYRVCHRQTQLDLSNTLVVAKVQGEIVGMVRLCQEFGCDVLRTMQVHPKFQQQGIGSAMLSRFQQLLREREIKEVYCMPYAHLERFYTKIGFKKISEASAPQFLQDRIAANRIKNLEPAAILMIYRLP